jgi:acetyl esterase/lipase
MVDHGGVMGAPTWIGASIAARRTSALEVFHPDLRRAARFLPRGSVRPHTLRTYRGLDRIVPSRCDGVESITSTASVRLHRPTTTTVPTAALLWIHGGGLLFGSAKQDDEICRRIASRLGVLVASVDYRLAPEHPFPAALDDCYDAMRWLSKQPGIERVAIGGASAGGGVAAAVALQARDGGDVMPAFQLLAYPMLDDRTALRTDVDAMPVRLWDNISNRFGWTSYLGRPPGADGVSGLAAPARAGDLAGLPPAWIGVGTQDLFHDEDLSYADRLRAAGVACSLEVVDGGFHGFDAVVPKAPVSKRFTVAAIAALGDALGA